MAAVIDKGKLLDQAQKYVQKGQIDKAIAEFQKVVDADPKDLKVRIRIGELYLKKGNKTAAVDEYSRVAESYSRDGFNLQAIAVYKQLLKMDTSIFEVYVKLANLYRKQGLVADALSNYRIVINYYEKHGKTREVIDTLKQMASMDPENFGLRAKLAELYFKNGNRNEGVEEYLRIADDLKKTGKMEEVVQLYLKILTLLPSCSDALRELGDVYFRMGKKKEALSRLQAAVKAEPNDVKALSLLAEVSIDQNELESARQAYEHLLRVKPSSAEAVKGIISLSIKAGDGKAAVKAAMPAIEKAIGENSYDSALGILLELYRNDVREREVLEKIADIYRLKGEKEKEIEVRNEIDGFYGKEKDIPEAVEIKEEEPEILEMEDAQVEEPYIEEPPAEENFVVLEEAVVESAKEDVSKYLTEAEVYIKYGLKDKAIDVLRTAHNLFPENRDVNKMLASLGEGLPGVVEENLPEIEEEISLELELPEEVEIPESPELEEIPEFEELPEEIPELETVEESGAEDHQLSKALEEAEFYIQQGLYDEARAVCNRIIESYPDNEEVLSKLKTVDDAIQAQIPQVQTPEEPAEEEATEGFFDLAAMLEEENADAFTPPSGMREAESFGFEDIFSEFKKGVESQLGKEDTETHYNLGIAYKEMGLLDDAIREFQIASSDSKMEFDCYNLIGLCYMEKDVPQKAVDTFRKGLSLPGRSNDEYASMNYELGQAYEISGMKKEALAAYMETKKKSPGFRDVESKIVSLGKN